MNKSQLKTIKNYSQGLISIDQLKESVGDFGTNILLEYLNDKNSSNLRQIVVCETIGLVNNINKMGYDSHNSNDEIKPKNLSSLQKKRLDAGGNYSDLTWKRHYKYIEDNVHIHVAGFIDGNLIFIIKFPYRDLSLHFERLLRIKFPNGDKKGYYLRTAAFSFHTIKNSANLQIEFIRKDLHAYVNHIQNDLYDFLIKHSKND